MRLPKAVLLPLACVLTLAAYGLLLFSDWGSYSHGGGPAGALTVQIFIVLAVFACWEVFRTQRAVPVRAIAAAVGAPLALVTLLMLWIGLRRYFAV